MSFWNFFLGGDDFLNGTLHLTKTIYASASFTSSGTALACHPKPNLLPCNGVRMNANAKVTLTDALVKAGFSDIGGVTRKQIELLGVEYPPKAGWVKRLIGTEISLENYESFLSLKNTSKRMRKELGKGNPPGDNLALPFD